MQQSYAELATHVRAALLAAFGALSLMSIHARAEQAMQVVYLKAPGGSAAKAGVIYQVRLPKNYISVKSNERMLAKPPGSEFLAVWAVYPQMHGMSVQNKAALINEQVPNTAVHIFLALSAEPAVDWAKQKRDAALRQPSDSAAAIQRHDDGARSGLNEYRYPNLSGNKRAVFFENETGAVFVNCLFEAMCDAARTWKNVFTVRSQFDRTQIQDMQELDRSVIRLLSTFEIKPAGNQQRAK